MYSVKSNCPNCGAPMQLVNNQMTCPHCGTTILRILDAKIDADVTVISPEEFASILEKNKSHYACRKNSITPLQVGRKTISVL